MRLIRDRKSRTFGTLKKDAITYVFSEDEPLIGLFAYQTYDKINQIGLYTLDTDCAATVAEEPEEEPEDSSMISSISKIIIIVTILILLKNVAACYLLCKKMQEDRNKPIDHSECPQNTLPTQGD